MEARAFVLRYEFNRTEHLARPREIEAALGPLRFQGREEVMRPIDIDTGIEGGELVIEGIAHKALSRKVIAFVGSDRVHHAVNAGIALERRRV